jgi:hypothetical protein
MRVVPAQLAQRPQLIALDDVGARLASLQAPDMQTRLIEVHLGPAEVDKLADAQAVPERHQDHQAVAGAVAVRLCRLGQSLNLGRLKVLTRAVIRVLKTPWRVYCRLLDCRGY